MRIINLPAADREFARAVAHMIKKERHQQAAKFVAEIDRTAALLAANPFLGAARADGTRGHALTEFPYTIYYVVRSSELVIAAIAHHSRREGYWRNRLTSLACEQAVRHCITTGSPTPE